MAIWDLRTQTVVEALDDKVMRLSAEFTHVYAGSQGKRIVPSAMAIRVDLTPVPVTDDSA